MRPITQKFRRLCLLFVTAALLGACTVEEQIDGPGTEIDGATTFTVDLPAAHIIQTRGTVVGSVDENHIETLYLLVIGKEGDKENLLVEKIEIDCEQNLKIDPAGQNNNKLTFTSRLTPGRYDLILVANAKEEVDKLAINDSREPVIETMRVIRESKWTIDGDTEEHSIPMYGELQDVEVISTSSSKKTFSLERMLARVNVEVLEDAQQDFELTEVRFYNYMTMSSVIPGMTGTMTDSEDFLRLGSHFAYTPDEDDDTRCTNQIYVFEANLKAVYPNNGWVDNPCIVVGGRYGNDTEPTWYRLDFVGEQPMDIVRNHSYNFSIKKVTGQGYEAPEDALESSPINMEAVVKGWDDSDIENGVWVGSQYIFASERSVEFDANGGSQTLTVETNVAGLAFNFGTGWTGTGPWTNGSFTVGRTVSGPAADGKYTHTLTVTASEADADLPTHTAMFTATAPSLSSLAVDFTVTQTTPYSPGEEVTIIYDGRKVTFAGANLNADGTFAENAALGDIGAYGGYFQFNRKTGWSTEDPRTSYPAGATWNSIGDIRRTDWESENDPCPEGWQIPTREDWGALINECGNVSLDHGKSTWVWPLSNGQQFYLPDVNQRDWYGNLVIEQYDAVYLSSTANNEANVWVVWLREGLGIVGGEALTGHTKANGYSIRCVRVEELSELTVNNPQGGTVTSDPESGWISAGTPVTVTVTADGNHVFSGWNFNGSDVRPYDKNLDEDINTLEFDMPAGDVTITPTLMPKCEAGEIEYPISSGLIWAGSNLIENPDYPITSPDRYTFAPNKTDYGLLFVWSTNTGYKPESGGYLVSPPDGSATVWPPDNDPCPTGWHVPKKEDFDKLTNRMVWNPTERGAYVSGTNEELFFPAAGYRYFNGSAFEQGTYGHYWSSTPNSSNAWGLYFSSDYKGNMVDNSSKKLALSVRCVRVVGTSLPKLTVNSPELPATNWLSLHVGGEEKVAETSEINSWLVEAGQEVTLKAKLSVEDYDFYGWGYPHYLYTEPADMTGDYSVLTFSMPNESVTIGAIYNRVYDVIYGNIEKGSVDPAIAPTRLLPGTTVTVTATPDSGFAFDGWTGTHIPAGTNLTANPLTFDIPRNDVTVTPKFVKLYGGENHVLYFDAGTIKVGRWGTSISAEDLEIDPDMKRLTETDRPNLAFFKFGSVVGFTNGDYFGPEDILFDPTGKTYTSTDPINPGPITYGQITGYYATGDYSAGRTNVSASNYHNGANLRAGKGDPCKLAGINMTEFNTLGSEQDKIDYLNTYNSGWRLPTLEENRAFIGLAPDNTGTSFSTGSGYYLTDGFNTNGTGIFPKNPTTPNVTLPAAGLRSTNGTVNHQGEVGYYWSSTAAGSNNGHNLTFSSDDVAPSHNGNYAYGISVRCVRQ
jgi:uncharacterized protein (TIGR02145 family)